jgi:hypothetical protein
MNIPGSVMNGSCDQTASAERNITEASNGPNRNPVARALAACRRRFDTLRTPNRGDVDIAAPSTRYRSKVLACALSVAAVSGAGLALLPSGADASTFYFGSTTWANAGSSTVTHQAIVTVNTQPLAGWSSQWITYRVAARDVTSTTPGPWAMYQAAGPWLVSAVIQPAGYCQISGVGCADVIGPTTLPSFTFPGSAGHWYEVMAQVEYWTGTSYNYGPWIPIEGCQVSRGSTVLSLPYGNTFCVT